MPVTAPVARVASAPTHQAPSAQEESIQVQSAQAQSASRAAPSLSEVKATAAEPAASRAGR